MYSKPTIQSFTTDDIRAHIAVAASASCSGTYAVTCTNGYVPIEIPLPSF
jgi:hypothetical protein